MLHLSLKAKILLLSMVLAAMTGLVGGISFQVFAKVTSAYSIITTVNLPNISNVDKMSNDIWTMRTSLRSLDLAIDNSNQDLAKAEIASIEGMIKDYQQRDTDYRSVDFLPGEKEIYDRMKADYGPYQELLADMIKLSRSSASEARKTFVRVLREDEPKRAESLLGSISELAAFHNADAQKSRKKAEDATSEARTIAIALTATSMAVAIIMSLLFSTRLSKQIRDISERLERGSSEIASASRQIADAGAELSSSSIEQAAALQETVSSIDQVSAMVSKNAENAANSQKVSQESAASVHRGKQVVTEMLQSIQEINGSNADVMNQTEASNQEIASIVKIISEIGNKTKVINDIVFQTRLLSFNASVEAARAGEHGKGFAVVAEEVGSLAQMSGNAAKEISQLLEESVQKVEKTVNDTRTKIERLNARSRERIDSGLQTARRCGEVFDDIVAHVNEVNSMIIEIAAASREQAQGVQEINKAMGQMDQVTQQNSSAADEAAGAAEQLSIQTLALRSMVESLQTTVDGQAGASHPGASPTQLQSGVAAHAQAKRVIPFKKKAHKAIEARSAKSERKMAVGSADIPAEDDPRFEDV